jgi:methylase of polypeptide subunit release factors
VAGGGPLRSDDPAGIRDLRKLLADAGYTPEGIAVAFRAEDVSYDDAREIPYLLRLLPTGDRLATFIRLFRLTIPVARTEAAAALRPVAIDRLERSGLLVSDGDAVQSTVRLIPFFDLVIACDREPPRQPHQDYVLGVTSGSLLLSNLVVRLPVQSALDMGTGGGVQALALARHAEAVDAVDVNPRALNVAAFNACLNGVENIRLLEGDLFEPVAGRSYDLVVGNPPYVISPDHHFTFRDAGLEGDMLSETVVSRTSSFLRDGGIGHLLIEWAKRDGEDWSAPVRRWVAGSGCDAILLQYASQEPLTYAAGWNRTSAPTSRSYELAIERWTSYLERLAIDAIGFGALIVRKHADGGSFVASVVNGSPPEGPAGHHVFRLLRAQEYLHALSDERELLDRRLIAAEDHRLDQTLQLQHGEGIVERAELRLEAGLELRVRVDATTVDLLAQLEGSRAVGEVLTEVAGRRPDQDRDGLIASGLSALRRLLELGFVVPADG